MIRVSLSLTRRQKRTYFVSLLFMFLNSILELFTLGLFIPFIGIIVSPQLLLQSSLVPPFLQAIAPSDLIFAFGGIVILLFIAKNITAYFLYSFNNRYVYSIATDLSRRKVDEYYSFSFVDFQKSNTAEMLRDIAYVPVEFAHHIILGSMIVFSESMILVIFGAAIALFQPGVVVMLVCTLLPFALLASYLSVRILRRTKQTIQETSPVNLRKLSDALSGYQEATLYNKKQFFTDRYLLGQEKLNVQLGKLNAANTIPLRLSEVFAIAGIMVILFFNYSIEGRVTASALSLLTLFIAFAYRAIPSINRILNAVVHMHTYSFTIDLVPTFRVRDETEKPENNRERPSHLRFRKSIALRDITFSYPDRKTLLLDRLSMHIDKGETIGLIGRSGLGKSTLLRIFLQLLKQNSGIITVDDKPIDHTNMLLWQSLFAYVTNESAILSDSVAANVAYGVPQASIDVDKVNSALRKVGLTGFTEQLSQGIMTPVGDQGKQISAGQKQRLLIARALYRNASIFIFDEAMSQLDARSEQDVLDTISSLRRDGITVIIVAHREHTLMECSKVYSLTHGKLRLVRKAKQPPKGN